MLVPPVSVTVKLAVEPSATMDGTVTAAVSSSSSSIVPVADETPRLTPDGSVVPVRVTVSVSSPSVDVSSLVDTVRVADVWFASIATLPELTAV